MAQVLLQALLPRITLLGVLLTFVFIRWRHRRAEDDREATRDARERWLTRIVVVSWLVPSWLWIGTPFAGFADLSIHWGIRLVGAAIAVSGLVLLWHVHTTLGRNFSRGWNSAMNTPGRMGPTPASGTDGFILALSFGLISGNVSWQPSCCSDSFRSSRSGSP